MAILVLLALAAAPATPPAVPVPRPQSFTAQAHPGSPRLGEPFEYTIAVTHPLGEAYALPRRDDWGDFDLLGSAQDDAAHGDQVTTTFHLEMRGWAVGKKPIPEVQLAVQTPRGKSELTIPGPTVDLVGMLDPDGGATEPLRDIAPPVSVSVRTYRVLGWAGGLLALLGLALFARRWLVQRPAAPVPAIPPEPAHLRAERALLALLAEDLPGQERQRELYFRLSEILRRYLGERFGFAAIDLTTEELLAGLRTRQTPGLDYPRFESLCHESDLAKFAKLQPEPAACKSAIDAALALVQATAPLPPAPIASGEASA